MEKKSQKGRYKKLEDRIKPVIGRVEKIELPGMGLRNIDAKIDTGAYGNAIHCTYIEVIKKKDKEMIQVLPLYGSDEGFMGNPLIFPLIKRKRIKNSFGREEERYIIKTPVIFMNREYMVEFSLTDRSKMRYPVLIGRKFLKGKFLVDCAKAYVGKKKSGKLKLKKLSDSEAND